VKWAGRIYKWIILSVLLQFAVLSYFNYIYLPGEVKVKATMYESPEAVFKDREADIPEDASHICVSHDGVYAAYLIDGRLEILNTLGKERKIAVNTQKGRVTFFRWLPDRNMVIYSCSTETGGEGHIEISTYDADNRTERSYPKITRLPGGSDVTDITLSPLTNIVYVKVKTSESAARIYRFNIMDNLSLVMKTKKDTIIKETLFSDNLVYQEPGGKIAVRGSSGGAKSLGLKEKYILLGIDGNDRVYAAEPDGKNMVGEILFGGLDDGQVKTWEKCVRHVGPPDSHPPPVRLKAASYLLFSVIVFFI
jgi:hypothetical protein